MELRHLRYFVAVAEELHFGRAAARLRVAQPPLSRQIRDLEREVGAPLFERLPRGVELTATGRAFLPEARLTLAQAERAQRTARRAASGEIGRLRVGFVEAATYSTILPDVLGFFRMHLPDIGVSLFELDSLEQADALREGRIDLGILHSAPADAERWLEGTPVYGDPLVVALPQSHRLASRSRIGLTDVASDSFVLFPRPSAPVLYDEIIAGCRSAGFSPRVVQEAVGWNTLAGLVAAAVGVGLVPRSLALLKRPGVVFRPLRAGPSSRVTMEMSAVWKRGDKSPVRERFVTVLRTVALARTRAKAGRRPTARVNPRTHAEVRPGA